MRTLQTIAAFGTILLGTLLADAHEFWVRPDRFSVTEGALGRFYLMHGHRLEGEFVPRNEPYVERFELIAADGVQRILGQHGQPTNLARYAAPGTSVVVYQSREVHSELGPEGFSSYLREQGLDHIARQREELGETHKDGIEVYVRCAKALVNVASKDEPSPAGLTDRVAGLPLEIVLEPIERARVGMAAKVRVLYDGKPLTDARLVAVSEADPDEATIVHTDENGNATFEINHHGPWMLTSLHMIRTDNRNDADWKSFWASLTFDVPVR